jgi:hypothetical protein
MSYSPPTDCSSCGHVGRPQEENHNFLVSSLLHLALCVTQNALIFRKGRSVACVHTTRVYYEPIWQSVSLGLGCIREVVSKFSRVHTVLSDYRQVVVGRKKARTAGIITFQADEREEAIQELH